MHEVPEIELIRLRKRLHQERFASWLAIGTLVVLLWWGHFGGMSYEVQLDGKPVAWLARDVAAARALAGAKDAWKRELGANLRFAQTTRVEPVKNSGHAPMTEAQAAEVIKRELKPESFTGVIAINGETVFALKSKAEAEKALALAMNELLGSRDNLIKEPNWKQQVTVREGYMDSRKVAASAQIVADKILAGAGKSATAPAQRYVVQPGDTGNKIAQSQGVPLKDLQRWNASVDFLKLRVGQSLVLQPGARKRTPLLTVVANRKRTFEESVPPPVQEEVSPGLARGQRRVHKPGRAGKQKVMEDVVEENGVVISRQKTIIVTTVEPEPRIVLVGEGTAPVATPSRPAKAAARTPERAEVPAGKAPNVIVRRPAVTNRRLPPPAPPID